MQASRTSSAISRLMPTSAWPLQPFDFHTPTRVVFGPGTLNRLGELAKELGDTRVLLVTDPGLKEAGHPQRAFDSLEAAGLEVFLFDDVEQNPTSRHVDIGARFARPLNIDLIVSVGGGSAMDCAKGINFILTNGGTMSDYKGFGKAKKPMLPSIGVPTTAGTGSEAQSYALIADEQSHMKMACGDRKAAFHVAILDPEVTLSQPLKVTALTGIDALSHALESYVTSVRNPLSQIFAARPGSYWNAISARCWPRRTICKHAEPCKSVLSWPAPPLKTPCSASATRVPIRSPRTTASRMVWRSASCSPM